MIFGVGSVLRSAFGFLLVPLYSRKLTAGEFGVLSLSTIMLTLTTILLSFGMNHAFFRHYYETQEPAHRRRIVGSTLVFLVFSTAALCAVLYVAAPVITSTLFTPRTSRPELLQLVFVICFFEVITTVPESVLRANFKSGWYSAVNVVAFVVQLGFISYLVMFVSADAHSVLLGRLLGSIFEAVIFFAVVWRQLSLRFSIRELRPMLAFGFPLVFGQIAFNLFMMIDRFFLARYSTRSEVGVYSMANSLVSVVAMLVTVPFSQVWTVMRFSVMNEEGAEEYYSRVLTYIVLVSMWLALGVAAVGGDGLLLFSLRGYWPAMHVIPLLALSAVLDGASRVLNIGITLRKRTVFAPLVIGAALVVNVALNFALIPRWGSLGAAASTVLSYVAFCWFRFWASNKFFRVEYEWGRVATVMALGSLIISFFYLSNYLRGDLPQRSAVWLTMLIKLTIAAAFPFILFLARFYDERERRRVSEVWSKCLIALRRQNVPETGAGSM